MSENDCSLGNGECELIPKNPKNCKMCYLTVETVKGSNQYLVKLLLAACKKAQETNKEPTVDEI